MVCLVLVLLAPKLILYMSFIELLATNFKDATFIVHLAIQYLRLKVVLQMVCLVLVLLAPKLILYMSFIELLATNFKDATFIVHLAIQYSFAIMQYLEN